MSTKRRLLCIGQSSRNGHLQFNRLVLPDIEMISSQIFCRAYSISLNIDDELFVQLCTIFAFFRGLERDRQYYITSWPDFRGIKGGRIYLRRNTDGTNSCL